VDCKGSDGPGSAVPFRQDLHFQGISSCCCATRVSGSVRDHDRIVAYKKEYGHDELVMRPKQVSASVPNSRCLVLDTRPQVQRWSGQRVRRTLNCCSLFIKDISWTSYGVPWLMPLFSEPAMPPDCPPFRLVQGVERRMLAGRRERDCWVRS